MRPSKKLLYGLIGFSILGLLVSLAPKAGQWYATYAWYGYGIILCFLVIWDGFALINTPPLAIHRSVAHTQALGADSLVTLTIDHKHTQPLHLVIHDHHPTSATVHGLPYQLTLPGCDHQHPIRTAKFSYKIRFLQRGLAQFEPVQALLSTSLNLWQYTQWGATATQVKVYPNFVAMGADALFAIDQKLSRLGVLPKQRRGLGLDFHQLREYRPGDEPRQIDWKATAKRKELISREYQDERDQQIMFLLDCGRRMRTKDGDLSHFDAALNASLALAYVALKQGDAVGFANFSGDQECWLSCHKGSGFINTLLNTVYHLNATQQASDYNKMAQDLMRRQKRRAFVIILTNMRDEHSYDLIQAVRLLQKRHLVMVANLRERIIDTQLDTKIEDFENALAYLGAFEYTYHRRVTQESLQAHGIFSLDITPNQLSGALVNRYFDVKRSGLL